LCFNPLEDTILTGIDFFSVGEKMTHRILVIDDDPELRELIKIQLETRQYHVIVAATGREGLRKAYQAHPDLILLDIMMPEMDGWDVCGRLRELSGVPIIMLTACTRHEDIVKGLQIGADDYLTKPFSGKELEARIKAVLRRVGTRENNGSVPSSFFTDGHLTIDFERRIATLDGKKLELSPTEYRLLLTLVRHEGRVLPHRYLLTEVWGADYADQVDYVKLYIRYLRKKIESDPAKPTYIQTEWGVGYRFAAV
jgi:two-component system KDP operon response regulator KdpE